MYIVLKLRPENTPNVKGSQDKITCCLCIIKYTEFNFFLLIYIWRYSREGKSVQVTEIILVW